MLEEQTAILEAKKRGDWEAAAQIEAEIDARREKRKSPAADDLDRRLEEEVREEMASEERQLAEDKRTPMGERYGVKPTPAFGTPGVESTAQEAPKSTDGSKE